LTSLALKCESVLLSVFQLSMKALSCLAESIFVCPYFHVSSLPSLSAPYPLSVWANACFQECMNDDIVLIFMWYFMCFGAPLFNFPTFWNISMNVTIVELVHLFLPIFFLYKIFPRLIFVFLLNECFVLFNFLYWPSYWSERLNHIFVNWCSCAQINRYSYGYHAHKDEFKSNYNFHSMNCILINTGFNISCYRIISNKK